MSRSDAFLLSIVVPVGDLGGHISELESWLINDSRIQIILVLDNADSETQLAILNSNKVKSITNLEIIEANFSNPGESRNRGMRSAKGVWINFTDADDIIFANKLIQILNSELTSDKNYVVGNYETFNFKSGKIMQNRQSNLSELLASLPMALGLWRFTFRREHLLKQEVHFPALNMAEDQIFYLLAHPQTDEIFFTDEVVYRYFVGGRFQLTQNPAKVGDLQSAIKITLGIVELDAREFFDFLPSQIYALLSNSAEISTIFKVKILFEYVLEISRKFGVWGLVRLIAYPIRRLF